MEKHSCLWTSPKTSISLPNHEAKRTTGLSPSQLLIITLRAAVPPKQRVHRILGTSPCFRAKPALPEGVVLSPGEECLGGISSGGDSLESLLTDRGVYLRVASGWNFVSYDDIDDVSFPEKSDPKGTLTLRTTGGRFDLLRGSPDLWEAGRFFMRCAEDAKGRSARG